MWGVEWHIPYEGNEFMGAFNTESEARDAIAAHSDDNEIAGRWQVYEFEIGQWLGPETL